MSYLVLALLIGLSASMSILEVNRPYSIKLEGCEKHYLLNFTSQTTVQSDLAISIHIFRGQFSSFGKFIDNSLIKEKPEKQWPKATQSDQVLSEYKNFLVSDIPRNSNYLSVFVKHQNCEQEIKFDFVSAYGVEEMDTRDATQLKINIPPLTIKYIRIQDQSDCQKQKYLMISATDQQNPQFKFNFFLSSDSLPYRDYADSESLYANHLQTQLLSSQCQDGKRKSQILGIFNLQRDVLADTVISIADFTFSESSTFLSTMSVFYNFQQSTPSQTYIFYNWSRDKPFIVRWNSHLQATLFLDKVQSEAEAKFLTSVKTRTNAVTLQNPGGTKELQVGPSNGNLYCGYCFYVIEVEKEDDYSILNHSLMVAYSENIEKLELNQMVTRKIQGGSRRYVFDADLNADYKVTAFNNAMDIEFSLFQDCRSTSDQTLEAYTRGQANEPAIFLRSDPNFTLGHSYCVEFRVKEQNENLDTYLEVSTINVGYSVLTNGQPGTLDFANSHHQFTRFYVMPLGRAQDQTEQITASMSIQTRHDQLSGPQIQTTPYCISVEAGLADAATLQPTLTMENIKNKVGQQFCNDVQYWDSLKLSADIQSIKVFKNAVILIKCQLMIPDDSKASSQDYDRLTFEIITSINAITSLSSSSEFGDQLTQGRNPFDLYKLHLPKNYTANVEVEPCLGEVQLVVYKSVQTLRSNHQFETIQDLKQGRIEFEYQDSGQSTEILFKVQLVTKKQQSKPAVATYRIRADMNDASQYREQLSYIPENEGLITIVHSKEDKVKIKWGSLMVRTNEAIQQRVKPDDLEYSIYQSSYNSYNLEALCTLIQYTTHLSSQTGKTTYEVKNTKEFGEDQDEIKIYLNVVATVISTQESIPYRRVEIIFIKKETQHNGIAMTYTNIIIVVGVVMLLIGFMFAVMIWKQKKIEREGMGYEVEDVRETAHIELAAMESRRVEKHEPLHQEE